MSCGKWERRLSDALDHELSARRAGKLEEHLAGCPACRAYRVRLERLRAGAAASEVPPVPAGYWDDFSTRLRGRIGPATEPAPRFRPRPRGRRWAWLAAVPAAAMVLILLLVSRPTSVSVPDLAGLEPGFDAASQAALEDPALAADLDRTVLASIGEETGLMSPEELPSWTDDPGFWEGLTDDEAALIDREIAKELKS